MVAVSVVGPEPELFVQGPGLMPAPLEPVLQVGLAAESALQVGLLPVERIVAGSRLWVGPLRRDGRCTTRGV